MWFLHNVKSFCKQFVGSFSARGTKPEFEVRQFTFLIKNNGPGLALRGGKREPVELGITRTSAAERALLNALDLGIGVSHVEGFDGPSGNSVRLNLLYGPAWIGLVKAATREKQDDGK